MTPHTAHRPPPMMANWLNSCNALVTTLLDPAARVIVGEEVKTIIFVGIRDDDAVYGEAAKRI